MVALNFEEILKEFGEILGKHRIWDGRSVGSKGLKSTIIHPLLPNLILM